MHSLKTWMSSIRYKISLDTTHGEADSVRKCIVSGLFPNAAYLHSSGGYRTVRGDYPVSVHPTSVLYAEKQPSWVVFAELSHTTKPMIRDLTAIDADWLETLAPHYYEKETKRFF